ncbi:MAG TPA: metal-dependent hydrolase [Xanthomonadales bacterium]|nr:metal-dependent hydrolase [Xanthomonadales bacterium]
MDSITQAFLGAACAAVVAPREHRRRALLLGAALGTLPDLDYLVIGWMDPVAMFTLHRSFSHSLLVLPWVGLVAWWLLLRRRPDARAAKWRWLAALELSLVTHPLLDCFTVYGTQLFWPLPHDPIMWSTIFIIDPAYTIWLVLGVAAAWFGRESRRARNALVMGLAISSAYLGWTLVAKSTLEAALAGEIARKGWTGQVEVLTVPTPFNSVLWRILVRKENEYGESFFSFLSGEQRTSTTVYVSHDYLLRPIRTAPAVERLAWFTHGFYSVARRGDAIVMTDLRMGIEPDYVFRFEVAEFVHGKIVALDDVRQDPWPSGTAKRTAWVWRRMFDPAATL